MMRWLPGAVQGRFDVASRQHLGFGVLTVEPLCLPLGGRS